MRALCAHYAFGERIMRALCAQYAPNMRPICVHYARVLYRKNQIPPKRPYCRRKADATHACTAAMSILRPICAQSARNVRLICDLCVLKKCPMARPTQRVFRSGLEAHSPSRATSNGLHFGSWRACWQDMPKLRQFFYDWEAKDGMYSWNLAGSIPAAV